MGFRVGATGRHVGTQYCLNADTGTDMTLAARAQADARLERELPLPGGTRTVRATLAADNVTNATAFEQCGLPGPGRTLRVMFSLR